MELAYQFLEYRAEKEAQITKELATRFDLEEAEYRESQVVRESLPYEDFQLKALNL